MANSAQARKRARQSEKHRQHNASLRSKLRTHIKKVAKAADGGDAASTKDAYQAAVPVIDAMAGKGLIHKNQAARHKSRLNQRLRSLQA